jgi:hypothetical protein
LKNRRSLGYARDDKRGERAFIEVGLLVEKTADPSATLGMTKGESRAFIEVGLLAEKAADPSAMLGMTTENDQPTLRAKLHRESAAGLLLP